MLIQQRYSSYKRGEGRRNSPIVSNLFSARLLYKSNTRTTFFKIEYLLKTFKKVQ